MILMNTILAIIIQRVNPYIIIAMSLALTLIYGTDLYIGIIAGIIMKLISKK